MHTFTQNGMSHEGIFCKILVHELCVCACATHNKMAAPMVWFLYILLAFVSRLKSPCRWADASFYEKIWVCLKNLSIELHLRKCLSSQKYQSSVNTVRLSSNKISLQSHVCLIEWLFSGVALWVSLSSSLCELCDSWGVKKRCIALCDRP